MYRKIFTERSELACRKQHMLYHTCGGNVLKGEGRVGHKCGDPRRGDDYSVIEGDIVAKNPPARQGAVEGLINCIYKKHNTT